MKKVTYVYEYQTESFETTLENAIQTLDKFDRHIVSVHVVSDTQAMNGYTHSAYVIHQGKAMAWWPLCRHFILKSRNCPYC